MFNKIKINEYLEILNNIKPKRLLYSFVLISDCIVETSFYILTPIVMKLMIDASVSKDMNSLKHGILIAAVVCILGMILFGTFEFFFFSIMHKTTAKVRNELFGQILHLPLSYIEENHSGDTLSRLTNDVNTMEASYGWPLRNVIVSIFVGIASAAVMMILDWRSSILLIGVGCEQYVQEALNNLMDNRTVLIIAHRLSTIKNADVIYIINEGKNIEQGNHEELLFKDSLYKELYELQFANN